MNAVQSPLPGIDWWTGLSAIAAAASALFAATQIYLTRRDSRRQTAFVHFREVEEKVQALFGVGTIALQAEVIRYYSGETDTLSNHAQSYLSLLNSLELLAFARLNGAIDDRLTDRYVKTLMKSHIVSLPMLRDLQKCCNDQAVFEHLDSYFVRLNFGLSVLPGSSRMDTGGTSQLRRGDQQMPADRDEKNPNRHSQKNLSAARSVHAANWLLVGASLNRSHR